MRVRKMKSRLRRALKGKKEEDRLRLLAKRKISSKPYQN